MSAAQDAVIERFWSRVDKDGPVSAFRSDLGSCWIWTGSKSHGYGMTTPILGEISAHRVSYSLLVRRVPDGLQLDHLCRVTHCVNPGHLEIVTPSENTMRGLKGALKGRVDVTAADPFRPVRTNPKGTRRQDAIVAFITLFSVANGYPPSVQEIADEVGLKSKSAAHHHLISLRESGRITFNPRIARSARVVTAAPEEAVA